MGNEIDLLKNYPKAKRNLDERAEEKTSTDRAIARKFGKEFFDGERKHGYGGFSYHPRFWTPTFEDFKKNFQFTDGDTLLDVGCAKGFMIADFKKLMPKMTFHGVDISNYAIDNSHPDVKSYLSVADAVALPFDENSFDYVISINTVHNLELNECKQAIFEIERVSKKGSFLTVDAYRNDAEKERMFKWNLTAKTILSVDEWCKVFSEVGYTGDYYWFTP
ncbi:class I SAM-dependent methyltransferase [Planktomarina temperata]|nr:class I SAM-dependent methyltransferase [Planktomarina temperata]